MGKKRKRAKKQPRSHSSVIRKPPRPVDLGCCGSLSRSSSVGEPPSPVVLSGEQPSHLREQNDDSEVKSVMYGVKKPCNVTDGDEGNGHTASGVSGNVTTSLLGISSPDTDTKGEEEIEIRKLPESWVIPSSPPLSEDSEESLNGDNEVGKPHLSTNQENLSLGLETGGLKGFSSEVLIPSHVDVEGIRRFQIIEGVPYSTRIVVGLHPDQERTHTSGSTRNRHMNCTDCSYLPTLETVHCRVHSPLWAGALVIVAEKSEEKNNFEEEKNQAGKRPFHEEGQRWRLAENLGPPVEEKVSSIAQALYEEGNWMVVIALATWEELATNWLGPGPDADGLSKLMDVQSQPDESAGESVEALTYPLYDIARLIRLPGFQVVMDGMDRVKKVQPLNISKDWCTAVNSTFESQTRHSPTVIVCGAKGSGKSTLCRYTVNRLLRRYSSVALLDCDVGQPEVGPPGLVSLHITDAPLLSPPHLNHLRNKPPDAAYFVGSTSPKQEPGHFIACVAAATRAYRRLCRPTFSEPSQATPLIVNTHGWVKGMGEHLLGGIVDLIRPQHIFKAAADLRSLRFVTYFLSHEDTAQLFRQGRRQFIHCVTPPKTACAEVRRAKVDNSEWQPSVKNRQGGVSGGLEPCVRNGVLHDQTAVIARALAIKRPFHVPWHCLTLRILGGDIAPDMTLMAFNGTLVGLIAEHDQKKRKLESLSLHCVITKEVVTDMDRTSTCYEEGEPARCLGLGIVRAIDMDKLELFVLTPLRINDLMQCNALYRGSHLNLPTELLYDPQRCCYPYLFSEGISTAGGLVLRNRSNLQRKKIVVEGIANSEMT